MAEILEAEEMQSEIPSISTDEEAESALLWLGERMANRNRMIAICRRMIDKYQATIVAQQNAYDQQTKPVQMALGEFAKAHPTKKTKTTLKLKLPSGIVEWKQPAPEVEQTETDLLNWVKSFMPDYVKVKESVMWAELKKVCTAVGDHYEIPDENGEMIAVDGVKLIERTAVLDITVIDSVDSAVEG